MFKIGDYVYDSSGDYGQVVELDSNAFGDELYKVRYGCQFEEYDAFDILTEFDLTHASEVEHI